MTKAEDLGRKATKQNHVKNIWEPQYHNDNDIIMRCVVMGQHSIYNMNFMYFQISPPNKPVEHISEELIAVFVGRSFPSTGW